MLLDSEYVRAGNFGHDEVSKYGRQENALSSTGYESVGGGGGRHLGEEGEDGDARMATHNRHVHLGWNDASQLCPEGLCPAHVQLGDAHQLLGIICARPVPSTHRCSGPWSISQGEGWEAGGRGLHHAPHHVFEGMGSGI